MLTGIPQGRLTKNKETKALPGWTWFPGEDDWEDGFACLESYVQLAGDSRVPQSYCDRDGFSLGWWVARQRGAYKQGTLEEERARRLELLPGWVWDARRT